MIEMLRFVLTNLARRKLRNAVTAGGVAFAVAALYCMASFQRGYQNGMKEEMDKLGAHLLVVPKGCPYDAASIALHGASWPCYLKSAYLRTVRETAHVAVAAPVFMSAVYDLESGAQIVYCGVQPNITALKRTWRIQGAFPGTDGILAGAEIARTRGWAVGQSVRLPGLENRMAVVRGVLAPTQGADDLFVYLPLADSQRIFRKPDALTHILVRLDDPEQMEDVASALRGCDAGLDMNVVPLAHLFHTIENLVQSTRLLLGSVALVALLAAGAGVSNAILMAVVERTREIGVLRAIGASRLTVFRLIWWETATLCLIGGVTGIVAALAGARFVESWLRARLPFTPHGVLVRIEWPVIGFCLLTALALGTLAGAIPAWRASRLAPSEAIRAGGRA